MFFFVIAQLISLAVFSQPSRAVWVGGAFVVLGGVIISVWSN